MYGSEGGFDLSESHGLKSGVWNCIIGNCTEIEQLGIPFKNCIIRNISNRVGTRFWKDIWSNIGAKFRDMIARLFALESEKSCSISDRWVLNNEIWAGSWAWRRPPSGRALDDLASLNNSIGSLRLTSELADGRRWSLDPTGSFNIKNLTHRVQINLLGEQAVVNQTWNSLVQGKVNICIWRVL